MDEIISYCNNFSYREWAHKNPLKSSLVAVNITLFAEDNYTLVWNKHRSDLAEAMKTKLEFIIGWLEDSGLKVNASKTEMCLFHRKDQPPIEITLTTQTINSKTNMNVLGVSFDSKLNWQFQIENWITKG